MKSDALSGACAASTKLSLLEVQYVQIAIQLHVRSRQSKGIDTRLLVIKEPYRTPNSPARNAYRYHPSLLAFLPLENPPPDIALALLHGVQLPVAEHGADVVAVSINQSLDPF